ncbi:MAG TPA: RpoL/Rpb11 RNA polymerase subunit family protein [Nitrosopumilaceae archaeon]|nr:RpoL/Rpb11 RNA polymerase subunit family protein [Nitrosopumilaceae archaeon]
MDAVITKSSPKEISLTISKSDIGTLYIVQHELLKESSIEFAGVIMKHPLTKEYWMRVNTSKGNPLKEIEKAAKTAIEYTDELKKAVHSKLKGV